MVVETLSTCAMIEPRCLRAPSPALVARDAGHELLGAARDDTERCSHLVRHASSQRSDGGQLLRADERTLEGAHLGAIVQGHEAIDVGEGAAERDGVRIEMAWLFVVEMQDEPQPLDGHSRAARFLNHGLDRRDLVDRRARKRLRKRRSARDAAVCEIGIHRRHTLLVVESEDAHRDRLDHLRASLSKRRGCLDQVERLGELLRSSLLTERDDAERGRREVPRGPSTRRGARSRAVRDRASVELRS